MSLRVIRVRHRVGEQIPRLPFLSHLLAKCRKDRSVEPFDLPVCLRVVSRRVEVPDSQDMLEELCAPLSESISRTPYTNTQCSQKARATRYAEIDVSGTDFVSFEYRSEITNKNRLPCAVLVNGHRMSSATNSSGLAAGNNFRN